MGGEMDQMDRLKRHVCELEALIAKWEHARDPESRWMLYLLREALDMGRCKLQASEADNPADEKDFSRG